MLPHRRFVMEFIHQLHNICVWKHTIEKRHVTRVSLQPAYNGQIQILPVGATHCQEIHSRQSHYCSYEYLWSASKAN